MESRWQQTNLPLDELAGSDEAIKAIALYSQWQDKLLELFHHASRGKRLLSLNCQEDLKYCSLTVRACTCSFCTQHGAHSMTNPEEWVQKQRQKGEPDAGPDKRLFKFV